MSPCIAMFDEVEGQLSGGKSTGSLDAGTSSQMNSRLLSWLSDKTSDVFVICSCNDISSLMKEMPEFARMGRFDGLFFLDYPTRKSKDDIWRIHLKSYGFVDAEGSVENVDLPKDENWTGAEIEACCRLARLRRKTIVEIGSVMPTISKQAGEQIQAVRKWAEGRCYAAEYEQLYNTDEHIGRIEAVGANGAGKRKLSRKSNPSLN
jgi:SpoVK/Ycf46/Vps4 family AAA+-type ATPase